MKVTLAEIKNAVNALPEKLGSIEVSLANKIVDFVINMNPHVRKLDAAMVDFTKEANGMNIKEAVELRSAKVFDKLAAQTIETIPVFTEEEVKTLSLHPEVKDYKKLINVLTPFTIISAKKK